jgi:hypothetical protein
MMGFLDSKTPFSSEADINDDGKIGVAEVIYILQKAAGMR